MQKGKLLFLLAPIFISYSIISSNIKEMNGNQNIIDPPFVKYTSKWVDSVVNSMTLDEKIGQLFMVEVYPSKPDQSHVDSLINYYHVGGLIYFKGHPTDVARLTNHFQSISKTPLMVAIDGEWGVAMRLDSCVSFPTQLMLGAISNNQLIYQMGNEIANQCKTLGINIDFAPVADINSNPLNPVIGVRSFGENKKNVAQKSYVYAQALQDNNILAVAKHFPGHGNTDVDSHKDLPIIKASANSLDTLELFPFKQLINSGIGGVMIAHLYMPAYEKTLNLPSTLSPSIINGLLRNKLQFKGLIFTDALNMQGLTKYFMPGDAEVRALIAGNDVLLMSTDVSIAFDSIKNAIKTGKITKEQIDQKVKKIISAKYWMGLNNFSPIDLNVINSKLNSKQAQLINRHLIENAITIIKNTDSILPLKNVRNYKIASLSIYNGKKTVFQDYMNRYAKIDNYFISSDANVSDFDKMKINLQNYDYVIVSIHSNKNFEVKTWGITAQTVDFFNSLLEKNRVILDLFVNPYSLRLFKNAVKSKAIVISYENSYVSQQISAQIIFGGIKAKGHLPVSINNLFITGIGFTTPQIRLEYSIPAELNINYACLHNIDTIIENAIANHVFPGCQLIAIKDNVVFLQKEYGYQTYDTTKPIKWDDMYDVASVTKILATTASLMKLYEQGSFKLNDYLGNYLPQLKGTNKYLLKNIDILTHQAKLLPFITFFHYALNNDGSLNYAVVSDKYSDKYCIKIAENLYATKDLESYYLQRIYDSRLSRHKRYKYSDLGFIMLRYVIENLTKEPIEKYIAENFYEPLGCANLSYNPLENGYDINRIPPTEIDERFRKQTVQGYVNDLGAASLGGVSGHAGIFASANDIAIFLQMFLQKGIYAGQRYYEQSTIETFTTPPFNNNRRGLGFDVGNKGIACGYASPESFGHTGFTGCMAWADPKYNFVFIFLSNRTYPDPKNEKINDLQIRQRIQALLYESFIQYAK